MQPHGLASPVPAKPCGRTPKLSSARSRNQASRPLIRFCCLYEAYYGYVAVGLKDPYLQQGILFGLPSSPLGPVAVSLVRHCLRPPRPALPSGPAEPEPERGPQGEGSRDNDGSEGVSQLLN